MTTAPAGLKEIAVNQVGPERQVQHGGWVFAPLMAVPLLAPLPFGSAQGIVAGIWIAYIGLLASAYFGIGVLQQRILRVPVGTLLIPALLTAATLAFLVIQVIPFGLIPGFGGFEVPGTSLVLPTISVAPDLTIFALARQLCFALFFFMLIQTLANSRRRWLALQVLLASVCAYAVYGYISLHDGDVILGMPKWAYLESATGPFVNRNSFATFLAIGTVLASGQIASLLINHRIAERDGEPEPLPLITLVSYMAAFLVCGGVLIETQSRMGLLSGIAGNIIVLALSARFLPPALRITSILVAVASVATLVFFGIAGGALDRLGSVGEDTGIRFSLYEQVVEMIGLRPLTGFGGGSFELAYPIYQHLPVSPDLVWERAHNTYLASWSQLGLIFGTLPILVYAILAMDMLRSHLRMDAPRSATIVALSTLAIVGIHAVADFSLEIPAISLLVIVVLAVGTSGSHTEHMKNSR